MFADELCLFVRNHQHLYKSLIKGNNKKLIRNQAASLKLNYVDPVKRHWFTSEQKKMALIKECFENWDGIRYGQDSSINLGKTIRISLHKKCCKYGSPWIRNTARTVGSRDRFGSAIDLFF